MRKLFQFRNFMLFCFFVVFYKSNSQEIKTIKGNNFELKICGNQKSILILFPCFTCDIENTKTEATFLKDIEKDGITTLILGYNQKLYLTEKDKINYAKSINYILNSNKVGNKNIYIGGFSSGGNISILLSNYLVKTKNSIYPKGVFVIDAPLDLEQLYENAKTDVAKNSNEDAVEEGKFLIKMFETQIGKPKLNIKKYAYFSPYIISNNSTLNIKYLKNTKIRFYCEPALEWQFKNRNRNYEELNTYQLEKTFNSLLELGCKTIEFIKTENRGIRSNGSIHPHSWSIVEKESLVNWMIE
jgi:Steryl acetyl hydrolase